MERIRNVMFGLAVLSTLGFGVASAAAQPGEAKQEQICPFMRDRIECENCCGAYGMAGYYVNGSCGCA